MSRVMSSVIIKKVIMTGLDRSRMETGGPVRRKAGGAVCTSAGVRALKASRKILGVTERTW